jgi:4a-hydroxytetrahydrobiopterin dehydratase
MTIKLSDRKCVPCQGGVPPLKGEALQQFLRELGSGWTAIQDHHLEKTYKFRNFREALDFTNAIGQIAEQEGHHPEITLTWGKVVLRTWTHKIDGLTENDFVLAAKVEQIFRPASTGQPAI